MGDTTAPQIMDNIEANVAPSADAKLGDMQAFKDATRLAKETQQVELEKSTGLRASKTVDSLPKVQFTVDTNDVGRFPTVQMPQLGGDGTAVPMPKLGGNDTSVPMPKLGGNDTSVRLPRPGGNDVLLPVPGIELPKSTFDNPDFLRIDDLDSRMLVTDFDTSKVNQPREPIALESAKKAAPAHKDLEVGMRPIRENQEVISTKKTPEGAVINTFKDGITETKHKDGTVHVQFPDKSGYMIFSNGEMLVKQANGDSEWLDKDGGLKERRQNMADGSTLTTDGAGRVISVQSDNHSHSVDFEYDAEGTLSKVTGTMGVWTREKDADGTVYWRNQSDPKESFDGELRVDSDGNIHATPNDRNAQKTVILRNGKEVGGPDAASGLVDEKVDEKGNIDRKVYDKDGRLISRGMTDEDGARRFEYDEKGKLAKSSNWNKKDGSWEETEFADNGNRSVTKRGDRFGNQETVTYDPKTGKEVASDIKFKDGSTMHVKFGADGNAMEISSKDANGNVRQWKRDADDPGATVKDTPRSFPMEDGISERVIRFPDGFKVKLNFASSGNHIASLWTSDNDVKGVKKPNLASIKR